MKFGITMFPTDYAIDPVSLGRAVEERGFDSLWFPDHTHIPVNTRSPWPGGSDVPREYSHSLDPFVALASVAATTKTLLLGTGVCLVIQRDPITLAKEVASLDSISGGRVILGVGGGWNNEEMKNHGTDPKSRWQLMRERVLAMKEIWTNDWAEFHGKFVKFDPAWSWPKPVQRPHPPVYIGGMGAQTPRITRHTLQRVIDYGDGWMPIPMRGDTFLPRRIQQLHGMATKAGRGPIPVTVFGTAARLDVIAPFADVGVERCVLHLPSLPKAEVLPRLDRYADLLGEFRGRDGAHVAPAGGRTTR